MKIESFEDRVSLYFDDALDPEGLAELSRLLAQPEMAARFVRLSRVHGGMRELSSVPAATPRQPRILRPWAIPAAAAAAFLAFVFILSRPSARLEQVRGSVAFDGHTFWSSEGAAATIVLPGGARLHAGSGTSLRMEKHHINLDRGSIASEISRSSQPWLFSTPHSESRISEGRFVLAADPDSTFCRVEEGRLAFLRKDTNQTVELSSGMSALAGIQADLKAEPAVKPAPTGGDPVIRIVAPQWPKPYRVTRFHKDSLLYGDRGWRITEIPSEVDGAQGIVTLAEDRHSREEKVLVFEIDREADVWVGIDARAARDAGKLPAWLGSWEPTGLRIHSETASNSYYPLYRRRFPAGTVMLGGNHFGGDTGAVVNYTVLVTAPK